jgi:UDP-hydrolysing UDP-N-acetyl-D-glucosamine 2-epimerase
MRRVCVVVTARPSYARIRSAMRAIRAHAALDLQLIVSASALHDEGGAADRVIEAEGFRIDRRVPSLDTTGGLAAMVRTTARGMTGLAAAFEALAPDIVVTIADRYETMATAVAASYMNLPLAHVQGGEVTGSIDEKVRHAITKLSDLHLVASEAAAERVRRMGENPARVIVTGCPSIDVAREALERADVPMDLAGQPGLQGFDPGTPYVVVLQHPVTTEYGAAAAQVVETLHAVRAFGRPALWFWPNVDAGSDSVSAAIRAFRTEHGLPGVHFVRNVPPEQFIRLLDRALLIVGNSSVGIRECTWLGVPTVNVGSRQQGRDRGRNVIDVPHDHQRIETAMRIQAGAARYPVDFLYGDGHAGSRIADALAMAELDVEKRISF